MRIRTRDRAKISGAHSDVGSNEHRKELILQLRLGNDIRPSHAVLLVRPKRREACFGDQRKQRQVKAKHSNRRRACAGEIEVRYSAGKTKRRNRQLSSHSAVSYTHLTLPTSD